MESWMAGSDLKLSLYAALLGFCSEFYFRHVHQIDTIIGKHALSFLFAQLSMLVTLAVFNGNTVRSIFVWTLLNTSFFFALLCNMAGYRLFFHRLQKYPGPFMARLSMFWKVGKLLNMNGFELVDRLHQQYGDIVRIGPTHLSLNSVTAVLAIYGPGTKCQKSMAYSSEVASSLQAERDIKRHGNRRPPWDKAFSARNTLEYLPSLYRLADTLTDKISKASANPILINRWLQCFSWDMMGELGFSKRYDCLESGKLHPAIQTMQGYLSSWMILMQVPWVLGVVARLPSVTNPAEAFERYVEQSLEERKQTGSATLDVMSYILDGKMSLSDKELQQDTELIQIAGSDTTLSVLIFVMYHLAANPRIQSGIYKEITDAGVLTYEVIKDLKLLDGVIKETLRLHPPVPSGMLRETPAEGIYVDGAYIPGHIVVSCPTWTIHRDPRNFAYPETFDPLRWSDPPPIHNTNAFIPFSIGPFNCVGQTFAVMELKYVVAKLVSSFRIRFASGEDGGKLLKNSKDHMTLSCNELWLDMKPR